MMATSIPILWPDDIKVDVLPPLAILRAQQEPLRRQTHGILEAETTTVTSEKLIRHNFDLIVPALGNYRRRVLSVTHYADQVYPVRVDAIALRPRIRDSGRLIPGVGVDAAVAKQFLEAYPPAEPELSPNAATEDQLIKLLGDIFRSDDLKSLIQSLIARCNEERDLAINAPEVERPPDES